MYFEKAINHIWMLCPLWLGLTQWRGDTDAVSIPVSVMMSRKEMKKLFKGVFMLMISGFHASFYITCDYGLYWLLDMLSTFFKKNLAAPGKSFLLFLLYILHVKLYLIK